MRVYLVRHPPPLIEAGVCYGRSDLRCAPEDIAATLAGVLPQLPPSLAGIPLFSSPLQRCVGLAAALSASTGAAARCDARLAEMDFGVWEMRRWDDIARAEVDAWAADPAEYRPGGGESVRQMAQRVRAFYLDVLAGGAAQAVVVCHAGSMRLLAACAPRCSAAQIALAAVAAPHRFAYGAVLVLEWPASDAPQPA
jgi:alpha-ribazole phosphatase